MDNFQLSMIQKLFTVRMMSSEKVDSQGAIVDEIQKHKKNLSALSHETAIDKRYLKSL